MYQEGAKSVAIQFVCGQLPHNLNWFSSTSFVSLAISSYKEDIAVLQKDGYLPEVYVWESYLGDLLENSLSSSSLDPTNIFKISSLDYATLHRQFQRHIASTKGLFHFESLLVNLIGKYESLFDKCKVQALLNFLPCHSYGDYAAIAVANSLRIPSCFVVSASLIDSLDIPLFRSVCTASYIHLNCTLAHSPSSRVERDMLVLLFSRISSKNVPYSQSKVVSMRERKSRSNVEALEILSSHPFGNSKLISDLNALLNQKVNNISFCRHHHSHSYDDNRYILACLHVEPEANICPMGHMFQDQLTFLTLLDSICLKHGFTLIVKEHPFQLGLPVTGLKANLHVHRPSAIMPRPLEFYKQIQKLRSFGGFSIDESIEDHFLSSSIMAVASVGGAVTLQAAVKGILAITGVDTWYKDVPNVININDCFLIEDWCVRQLVTEDLFVDAILPYVFSSSFDKENESYCKIDELTEIVLRAHRA